MRYRFNPLTGGFDIIGDPSPVTSVNGKTGAVSLIGTDMPVEFIAYPNGGLINGSVQDMSTSYGNALVDVDQRIDNISQPPFSPDDIEGANTNARVVGKLSGTTYGELVLNMSSTPDSVPRRDANGQMQTALVPTANAHVASKQYVDNSVSAVSAVESVTAGSNVTVDNTDAANPVISADVGVGVAVEDIPNSGSSSTSDIEQKINEILATLRASGAISS